MKFAAPGPRPCLPQKRPGPSKESEASCVKEEQRQGASPALQRLRAKLAKGQINSVERQMLCMLERQSATEVKTALAAKAAMASAARESDDVPLTSAQAHARFVCRAQQTEIARAKARTQYVPQGPPVEGADEEKSSVSKKRQYAEQTDNESHFWSSYFQKVPTAAARHAIAQKQRQRMHSANAATPCCDKEENENEEELFDEEEPPSDYESLYDSSDEQIDDYSNILQNSCDVSEVQGSGTSAAQQAFTQLLRFVKGLPDDVASSPAAARLKTFSSLQVTNKQGLAAAARQVWLAVHPDKNHVTGAQEATQEFGKLLGSYKEKGLL